MMLHKLISLLILCLVSSIHLHSQTNYVNIADSIYYEKEYNGTVNYVEEVLQTVALSNYQKIGLNYYAALANYRLNDFTSSNEIIQSIYDKIDLLNPSDSIQARIMVDICQRMGDYSFMTENYNSGIGAMKKGLELLENHLSNDHWRTVKLLHKNGAVLRIQGSLTESKTYLDKALVIIDSLPADRKAYITPVIQSEIAGWYNYNHQPKKAIKVYNELIIEAERDSNYRRIDIYNNNISNSYARLNDYGKALFYQHNSLKAKNKIYPEHHPKIVGAYNNLANIYMELDDLENAEKYWIKTTDLIKNNLTEDQHVKLTILESTKGKAYLKKKQYEKAIYHFLKQETEMQLHQITNDEELGDTYRALGYAYGKINEHALAKENLFKAIKIRKSMDLEEDYIIATSYLYLYDIFHEEGDDENAGRYLDMAFNAINLDINDPNTIESAAILANLIPFFQYKINALSNTIAKGEITIEKGQQYVDKSEELMQQLRFTIDDLESTSLLLKDLQPLHEAIIYFYITAFETTGESRFLSLLFNEDEKANNTFLYQHLAENASEKYGIPKEVINKKNKLIADFNDQKEIVNENKLKSTSNFNAYDSAVEILYNKKRLLYDHMAEIDALFPQYYERLYNYPINSLEKTQKSLHNAESILQYISTINKVYCLQINSQNVSLHELGDQESITNSINKLNECIDTKGNCVRYQTGLYDILVKPMSIKEKTTLNIVPGTSIGNLPFELLVDNNGQFLLEKHPIYYQYSSTLKSNNENRKQSGNDILAMAPLFDEEQGQHDPIQEMSLTRSTGQLYLPNSLNEVSAISELFNIKSLVKSEATIHNFLTKATEAKIIHLATHGIVDHKNPNLSKLLFTSDDHTKQSSSLHADEIVGLDLHAELVTLSACNTGTGKIQAGEGVSSLGRAFTYAGCPNQVISLWSVNDISTSKLMTYFYENLKEGMTKPQAIQEAKIEYLQTSPQALKHPYYWAGFVYYGNDLPISNGNSLWLNSLLFCCLGIFVALGLWTWKTKALYININSILSLTPLQLFHKN